MGKLEWDILENDGQYSSDVVCSNKNKGGEWKMEEQRPDTERKRDGFRGERMIVLPTEAFSDYVRHPLVRRLYLTDVGFFPSAAHHYRERKEGIVDGNE